MSAVWVRLDEAQRGSLPARCARRGVRCVTRHRRTVRDLPPVLEWVAWTGLWPRGRDGAAPTVVLPLLPRAQRLDVALRRVRDVTAALLPACLLVALLVEGVLGRTAGSAAILVLAVHLVVAAAGLVLTVRLQLDDTGGWVRLSGVHREFVAATEAVTTRPTTEPVPAPLLTPRERPPGDGSLDDVVEP